MSEECRDCGRTDGGCDRVRDQSFERATGQDDRVCDHPCLMKHTRYTDTGEVADPGGCYWDRTRDDGNGVEYSYTFKADSWFDINDAVKRHPDQIEAARQWLDQFKGPEPDENGGTVFQLRKSVDDEPDPVNPPHYLFPGGVETSEITRYLTSNGGQSTQYIIRSTRLDGNNKSSTFAGRIEDLRKAVWFIEDEISRLEDEAAQA